MKKFVSLFVSMVLLFNCFAFVAYAGENTSDYSEWAKDSINSAYNKGFLSDEKDYKFKDDISRLDFCELIICLVEQTPYFVTWCEENLEDDGAEFPSFIENPFTDTQNEMVLFLNHIGIINGKSKTEFAPNDKLTREEAATIIVRMMDIVSPDEEKAELSEYSDSYQISDWALDSVKRISSMGYMQGVGDNKFAPQDTYTTEQAVVTVMRIYDANIMTWIAQILKFEAGELGYVYENDTWNYVTFDFAGGRRVKPLDVNKSEFKILSNDKFASDNNYVYYLGIKIEDADPLTFKTITDQGDMCYAKDKNFVYVYTDSSGIIKVIGADPDTFEVLEFPYSKDKNDAYNGCLPLYVDDVTKFTVVSSGEGFTRITAPEAFLTTVINSKEVADYNNQKYGFINSAVIYSMNGIAKTENLIYIGYMLTSGSSILQFVDKDNNVIITENDIISCTAVPDDSNNDIYKMWCIELSLSDEGKTKLKDATKIIVEYPEGDNYISIKILGEMISAPRVMHEIDSDKIIISGGFTQQSAKELEKTISFLIKK